jgi:hypothetical protein
MRQNTLAPFLERKHPDIFCCTLIMRAILFRLVVGERNQRIIQESQDVGCKFLQPLEEVSGHWPRRRFIPDPGNERLQCWLRTLS